MRSVFGCTIVAAAAWLAMGQAAQAASFTIPAACKGQASGSEEELDPVVIISFNAGKSFLHSFPLEQTIFGSWYVTLQNVKPDTYFFATTYTPFLTSTLIQDLKGNPSELVVLPAAGTSSHGSDWRIYPVFTLTVLGLDKTALPGAIVDFIPAYAGSSPYTMQADGQGKIVIHCLQAEGVGYAVTVRGSDGRYLYDGSFIPARNSASTAPYDK